MSSPSQTTTYLTAHKYKFSEITSVTLKRTPRDSRDVEKVVQLTENAVEEDRGSLSNEHAMMNIQKMPSLLANVCETNVPQPETVEYMVSSFHI